MPPASFRALRRCLCALLCASPGLLAQNYQSYMNSTERARESMRYEAALLEGTYNNPMNQPGMSISAEYQRRYQAQKQAEQNEALRAADERRQREYQRQRDAAAAEAREQAILQEEKARQARRDAADAKDGALLGKPDLSRFIHVNHALFAVSNRQLSQTPSMALAGAANYLQDLPNHDVTLGQLLNNGSTVPVSEAIALLADEALRRGETLPAIMLADPAMRTDEHRKVLSFHGRFIGNEEGELWPVYYTGWYWPSEYDVSMAENRGLVKPGWREEYARIKPAADKWGDVASVDLYTTCAMIMRTSRLLPWMAGKRRIGINSAYELIKLRTLHPALGHFMTALLEERYRLDETRPSPYADLMFEKAAQLAGPGFIRDFAKLRRERLRERDAKALADWRNYRLRGANPTELANLDDEALFRVAGRLALNQDVAGIDPEFGKLQDEEALLRFRRLQVHGILWDLTLKGSRYAFTVQYLAAIQDTDTRTPTLHAYLQAYRWLLGWDYPEDKFREIPLTVASQLETLPATIPGAYYAGSKGYAALDMNVPVNEKDSLSMVRLYSRANYDIAPARFDLPLPAAITPATLLLRKPGPEEAPRIKAALARREPMGFGALLSLTQIVAWAHKNEDSALLGESLEKIAQLHKIGHDAKEVPFSESLASLESLVLQFRKDPAKAKLPTPELRGLNGDAELQFGLALNDCLLSSRAFVRNPQGFPI